ncbi:MAG: hypothetical protein ACD_20C00050G0001 [uncultured bacterium]|nr:MAG: hypothetical protein ACD_20C00050G0001 [uncultured bacterium]
MRLSLDKKGKTMGYNKTEEELLDLLKEQLSFLVCSSNDFDKGNLAEAKRIATTIRNLVHDTNRSISLLKQLEKKNILFYDTTQDYDPDNLASTHSLIAIGMSNGVCIYTAPLDNRSKHKVSFSTWWEKIVFSDQDKKQLTRKDLILIVANKEGGSHIDPQSDDTYIDITKFNSLGWMTDNNSLGPNPILVSIRQLAHEFILTLKDEFSCLESIGEQYIHNLNIKKSNEYNDIGAQQLNSGDFKNAVESFNKSIYFNQSNFIPYSNLGLLYLFGEQNLEKAEENCKKAIELNPVDYKSFMNLGIIFGIRENLEEAIKYLEIARTLNPNDIAIYKNLGFAYKNKNNRKKSIEHYQKVIELNPNDSQTYNILGILCAEMSNLDNALIYFEKAVELESENPAYNKNLQLAIAKKISY